MESKKMLIGRTEYDLVYLKYDDHGKSFGMSGTCYNMRPYTYQEVLDCERESFMDSGCWEDAVRRGNTEKSKSEFYECWIDNTDLGDWMYISGEKGEESWFSFSSCGQIIGGISAHDFVFTIIPERDVNWLWFIWERYHMVPMEQMPTEILERVKELFEMYEDSSSNDRLIEYMANLNFYISEDGLLCIEEC